MNELMLTSLKKEELSVIIEDCIRKVMAENKAMPDPKPGSEYLNVEEASTFLNLAKATIYALSSARKIPVMKKGKKLLFLKQNLVDWVNTGRKKTIEEIEREAVQYLLK